MLEIKYLPAYHKELAGIIRYITYTLESPKAARKLEKDIKKAINNLPEFPLAHRLYRPLDPIELEFRVLTVKNYCVFYTVGDYIVIHHVYYKGRDFSKLIK